MGSRGEFSTWDTAVLAIAAVMMLFVSSKVAGMWTRGRKRDDDF